MGAELTEIDWERKGVEMRAVVETPRGSRYKYAFNPATRALGVRFMLARGLSWPYDYGFIPQTLAEDGDPVDVIVMMEEPVLPLSVVQVRLIGGFELFKNEVRNDRLLACPKPMPGIAMATDRYTTIDDLPDEECAQIARFLCEYSEEQGNEIRLAGRYGPDEAVTRVSALHKAWKKNR